MKTYACILSVFVISIAEPKDASPKKLESRIFGHGITQKLRYMVVGTSLLAISADGLVEYYYGKYKGTKEPAECALYRERTQLFEKIRDVSIWAAGVSLVGFIIAEKLTSHLESHGFLNKFHLELSGKNTGIRIWYEI